MLWRGGPYDWKGESSNKKHEIEDVDNRLERPYSSLAVVWINHVPPKFGIELNFGNGVRGLWLPELRRREVLRVSGPVVWNRNGKERRYVPRYPALCEQFINVLQHFFQISVKDDASPCLCLPSSSIGEISEVVRALRVTGTIRKRLFSRQEDCHREAPQPAMAIALQESVGAIASSRYAPPPATNPRPPSWIDRVWFLRRNKVHNYVRNCTNKITDRKCGILGKVNSGHSSARRDATLKAPEVRSVHDSFLRVGLMIACPPLGLSMMDLGAVASELDPISSSTLSADLLPRSLSVLGDLDPGTAQLVTTFAGPFITVFNLLFILRIVMSWYPGIPSKKFPFFLVYNPTEPVLGPTRRLIPPVGGVDVAPVIWVALMSFANEILLGKQGLLVLLSQQQS